MNQRNLYYVISELYLIAAACAHENNMDMLQEILDVIRLIKTNYNLL
jgi:hypothetical protein